MCLWCVCVWVNAMMCVAVIEQLLRVNSFYLSCFFKITSCLFINFGVCVCTCAMYDLHVKVREQLAGVSSLFPSCRFCGLLKSSGNVSLPAELTCSTPSKLLKAECVYCFCLAFSKLASPWAVSEFLVISSHFAVIIDACHPMWFFTWFWGIELNHWAISHIHKWKLLIWKNINRKDHV